MRLGDFLVCCVLGFSFLSLGDAEFSPKEETNSERRMLFVRYLGEVRLAVSESFPEWAEDLAQNSKDPRFTRLRLHATPFDEPLLPVQKRVFFFLKRPFSYGTRPSSVHLNVVRATAEEVRGQEQFSELRPVSHYLWTEADMGVLESAAKELMTDAASELELAIQAFHEDHRAPSQYEIINLLKQYLELWSLGALWEVESERYLKSFPIKGSHSERLRLSQLSSSEQIGDCRIAIVRLSDPSYRW